MTHEQVSTQALSISFQTAKLTIGQLYKVIKAISQIGKSKPITPDMTKVSVRDLQGISNSLNSNEVEKDNLKILDKFCRKYGVKYAIQKDSDSEPPKYTMYFRKEDSILFEKIANDILKSQQKSKGKTFESVLSKVKEIAQTQNITKNAEKVKEKFKNHERSL